MTGLDILCMSIILLLALTMLFVGLVSLYGLIYAYKRTKTSLTN